MSEEPPTQPAISNLRRRAAGCLLWALVPILLGRFMLILHAPVYEHPEWWFKLGLGLYLLLPFSFVIIFAWPPDAGQRHREIVRRLWRCALVGWFIQVAIHYCILETAIYRLTVGDGINPDPVIASIIATYFCGWLIALILALPFIPVARYCDAVRERRRRTETGA